MNNTLTVEAEEGTTEKEIALPAYRRWDDIFYKIISERKSIRVGTYEHDFGIAVHEHLAYHATCDESFSITEEEFTSALNSTLQKINEAVKH